MTQRPRYELAPVSHQRQRVHCWNRMEGDSMSDAHYGSMKRGCAQVTVPHRILSGDRHLPIAKRTAL